jgi:hypothetical protein
MFEHMFYVLQEAYMKKTFWVLFFASVLMTAFLALSQFVQAQDVPRITKEELKKQLCSKSLMLIDVRVPQGWKESNQKIKCATRMEPDKVSDWASALPKNKEIVFYCS